MSSDMFLREMRSIVEKGGWYLASRCADGLQAHPQEPALGEVESALLLFRANGDADRAMLPRDVRGRRSGSDRRILWCDASGPGARRHAASGVAGHALPIADLG